MKAPVLRLCQLPRNVSRRMKWQLVAAYHRYYARLPDGKRKPAAWESEDDFGWAMMTALVICVCLFIVAPMLIHIP